MVASGSNDDAARGQQGDGAEQPTATEADEHERPVLVTGICGRLGRRLARMLHRDRRVVGLDRRVFRGCPKDIHAYQVDVRRKKTKDVFRQEHPVALVHLGVLHDLRASPADHHTWNVVGLQRLLEYASQYGVSKIVVLSSANVYGARPDNPQFLSEDAPLQASESFSAVRDLVEVDMLAQSFFWKHPEVETVILRPGHILGAVRNAPSNYLRHNVVPTLLGYDPMMQVIHQSDVVRAILLALVPGVRGIFNLAGPPAVPLSRIVELTGRAHVAMPLSVLRTAVDRLWRIHASSFPAQELDFIRYVCMVDDARARQELGFTPAYGLEASVRAVDDYD
jgi:UDP-glucose 4-epimerase